MDRCKNDKKTDCHAGSTGKEKDEKKTKQWISNGRRWKDSSLALTLLFLLSRKVVSEQNGKFQKPHQLSDGCGAVIHWEKEGWISPFLLPGKNHPTALSSHQSFTVYSYSPVSCPLVRFFPLPNSLFPFPVLFFCLLFIASP